MKFFTKFGLAELALVAIALSALNLLDGELFYLTLLRGEAVKSIITGGEISILGSPAPVKFVGSLGNYLSTIIYNNLLEKGLFVTYVFCLIIGSVLYYRILNLLTNNIPLSFILGAIGTIGIVSSIRDLEIAIAYMLSGIELLVLVSCRQRIRNYFFPIYLLHFAIDSSCLLVLAFYFLGGKRRRIIFGILTVLVSCLLIQEREFTSLYSMVAATLIAFFGLILAVKSKEAKLIFYSLIVPLLFGYWEYSTYQRFPALCFFLPLAVGNIWTQSDYKEEFKEGLIRLQNKFSNFLTIRNQMALSWFCLAFIFFNCAGKFVHPVNEAYLPKEALDVYAEERPNGPMLHPAEVGGYVGYRLKPVTQSRYLNYSDFSSKTLTEYSRSQSYRKIWNGENDALFKTIDPKNVLCRGGDRLCKNLLNDKTWAVRSRSSYGDKILQKLPNLPDDKKRLIANKLEQETWYLLNKG